MARRSRKATRSRLGAAVFLALLLAPMSVGAGEVTIGTATAESILVRLTSGLGTVAVGTDDAQATLGSNPRAFARFITGKAAEQQVGAAERETTTKGESASASVGDSDVQLGDFLDLGSIGADITTEVADGMSSSSVVGEFGGASIMRGLATLDVGETRTESITSNDGSHVSRHIHLAGFRALALRDFLAAISVSPLDLGCDAVEDLGVLLGIDAANCQSLLDTINGLIANAIDALQAAESQIVAARDAVLAAIDLARSALADLQAQVDTLQTQLGDLATQIDAAVAEKTDLEDDRAGLEQALGDLEATEASLQAALTALETQTAGVTESQVLADRNTVTSCDGLSGLDAITCQINLLTTSFPTLASTYGVDLSGLGFADARALLLAELDALLAAFDEIDSVTAELATVTGQIDAVNAQIDALTVQIDALAADIATLTADASDIESAIATLNGEIDDLQADIAALEQELEDLLRDIEVINAADATEATCADTSATLDDVATRVPSLASELDPIADDLGLACGDLEEELLELLAIPLVTVDGIDITIDVRAREGDPTVSVTGTIGSVQIGELEPIVVDVPAGSDEIPVAQAIISTSLATIADATGIDLPAPEFGFLVTEQESGQGSNGTWYANGSVTFIRLSFPEGTINVPSEPPLGVLDGADPSLTLGSPVGAFGIAADSPEVTLDVATFDAAATFLPSDDGCVTDCGGGCTTNCGGCTTNCGGTDDDGGGGGGPRGTAKNLPRTGVAGFGWFLPAVLFGSAGLLRRFMRLR